MPLVDANGQPLGAKPQQAVQSLGFAIFKKVGHGMVPMVTEKGNFAIIPTREQAVQVAGQLANEELIPSKDQKVVTPQQKSSVYYVVHLQVLAQIQGQIKNPEALLAPAGVKPS